MATKDQEQANKLQGDFLSRAMESANTLREGKPQRVDAIVKDGTERLNAAKARLDSAKQDRDDMVRRMDERIARLTDDVTRLETGVDALRNEVTDEAPKPTRGKRRSEPS